MDKVNQKMRKFNLRGVLIGLRATALGNSPHKTDSSGIEESLRSEHFQVAKVSSSTSAARGDLDGVQWFKLPRLH